MRLVPAVGEALARPRVEGKFLFLGDQKLYVRGATYGTFRSNGDDEGYPAPDVVAADLAAMSANGLNAVRTYTLPPHWFLDLAAEHGLHVLAGIAWEQHVAFLDDRGRPRSIEQQVRAAVRSCAGHPALLGFSVGNEIPAPIVRWHGRHRVERFLERLYAAAKDEDPESLVTYVNYPSTEYLELPFVDMVCFNVFLEHEELLDSYLARLQNLAGDKPLVIAELGYDSARTGHLAQALVLGWQVRTAFATGCAGTFLFSWTDEWHRGGHDVEDWHFGLVDADRRPKPALREVSRAFAEVPLPDTFAWPSVSVVVCTHNGAATLAECLDAATRLDYPDYEVIVVDDGSTDETAEIAARYDVQLLRTPAEGLGSARNTGLRSAGGEIVAYLDDDAAPDPHWLRYLAAAFTMSPYAGIGGPNIPPTDEGFVARCVARAPGAPQHVLITDRDAEHIPGCNMAFRKEVLDRIGGFDPRFRAAGDDVDICWRLEADGWTIGFAAAATVLHRRRSSLDGYLRQQFGYGKAEALLERKWPEKYNRGGHVSWAGRVYEAPRLNRRRWRIYYGMWGDAPFQPLHEDRPRLLASLPQMAESYLLLASLLAVGVSEILGDEPIVRIPGLGLPLAVALAILAFLLLVTQAARAGWRAWRGEPTASLATRLTTALFYLLQPPARLLGRARNGLTPWRHRGMRHLAAPWPRAGTLWREQWRSAQEWLRSVESTLRRDGASVVRGGEYDRWDLQVRSGMLASARLRCALEEHGHGRQLLRFRIAPHLSLGVLAVAALLAACSALSGVFGEPVHCALLGIAAGLIALRALRDYASASSLLLRALSEEAEEPATGPTGERVHTQWSTRLAPAVERED